MQPSLYCSPPSICSHSPPPPPLKAPGFEKLTTALYTRGDPYLGSDAVFGVRSSLIVDLEHVDDEALTRARGFEQTGKGHAYLRQDFVLARPEEGRRIREGAVPVA